MMKRKIIDEEFISRLETLSYHVKTLMNGYHGGNHPAPSYGSTVEFADFREYMPGDDIRSIDWNLYSRFDKYFIRLFVDERQLHNQIFIDCSASMGSIAGDKSEAALKIAAAMGYLSVQEMDRVSIKTIKGKKANSISQTMTGKDALFQALNTLSMVDFQGSADLGEAICTCQEPGYDDGMSIIISDFLTESDWKKAVDYLLYRHREVMLIQVLTPQELDPAYNGKIQFIDVETNDFMDERNLKMKITKSSYLAYKDALADYLGDMEKFCRSRNVSYLMVDTSKSLEKQLFGQLYEKEVIR